MADTVAMPKLGFDMAEGNLVRWLKKVNETVEKGQPLAEIETDKATVEVESPYSGVVLKLIVDEGTSVPVGDPIAVIGLEGESVNVEAAKTTMEAKKPAEKPIESVIPQVTIDTAVAADHLAVSPIARRIASEKHVDLTNIKGTGPGGRIVRKDVEAVIKGQPSSLQPVSNVTIIPGDEHIPVTKLRAAIGRRMLEAKQTIPHFYVTSEMNVDRLLDLREQINSEATEDEKLSINDYLIKAVALALRQFPNLNASISGSELTRHGHIHIGVAVAVEGGLLTVVVKDADLADVRWIGREVKEMAGRVRNGKVKPEDIEGSTFSISNLGMFDVENFAAIINPPETAILAVASARDTVIVEEGEMTIAKMMKVTLSADHRVTDGAEAAKFMQALKKIVENPAQLLLSR